MHIRSSKRIFQHAPILIRKELKYAIKTMLCNFAAQLIKAISSTDAGEDNAGMIL